jgi:hypothetical protein
MSAHWLYQAGSYIHTDRCTIIVPIPRCVAILPDARSRLRGQWPVGGYRLGRTDHSVLLAYGATLQLL